MAGSREFDRAYSRNRELARCLYRYWLNRDEALESPAVVQWADAIGRFPLDGVFRVFSSCDEFQEAFVSNPVFREWLAPEELPRTARRVHHWHIPKTAGLSVRAGILSLMGDSHPGVGYPLGYLKRLSVSRLRSMRVFSGHYGSALEAMLPGLVWYSATLFRDPIDHATSLYAYQRQQVLGGKWGSTSGVGRLAAELTFSDWLRCHEAQVEWVNFQSKFLVLDRDAATWPDGKLAELVESAPIEAPPDNEDLARRLLDRVSRFSLVGSTDNASQWFELLSNEIAPGRPPGGISHCNRSGAGEIRKKLSRADRELILEQSWLDGLLFGVVANTPPMHGEQLGERLEEEFNVG